MNNDDYKELYNKYAVVKDGEVIICETLEEAKAMTSSANDEWDYGKLRLAINLLDAIKTHAKTAYDKESCQAGMDFIEYNIRELEIHESNGD